MPSSSAEPYSLPYSLCISAIKDLKTLVEVAAIHYCGEGKKWNFIAFTEAAKVLVRLALFWNTAYKMLLHGGETPNTETNMDFSGSQQGPGSSSKLKGHIGPAHLCTFNGQNQWNLERRARSSLSRFGENARMVSDPVWLHRVQRQHAIMEPPPPAVPRPTLSMILSEKGICRALFVMGELLFIMRPLIYVLFIRKYGMQSWIPWFLSLGVDFIGAGVLAQFMKTGYGGKWPKFHLTVSEQDELKRRKLLWALYPMRDPFFSKYTRQRVESTEKLLEPVRIIGFLTGMVFNLFPE